MKIDANYSFEISVGDIVHPDWTSELLGVVVSGRDDNCYNVISQHPDTGGLFIRHGIDLSKDELNEQYVYVGHANHISVDIGTASKLTKDDVLNVYKQVERAIYEGDSNISDYSGLSSEFDNMDE